MRIDLKYFLDNLYNDKNIEKLICNLNSDEILQIFESDLKESTKERFSAVYYKMTQK